MPQPDSVIPDDDFGKVIRLGERIFRDTGAEARGLRRQRSALHELSSRPGPPRPFRPPLGGLSRLPAYRAKNGHVNTFAERLQGCFRYSMNGKAPPLGDPVLVALETYAAFLAHGAPVGMKLPGQGYPNACQA